MTQASFLFSTNQGPINSIHFTTHTFDYLFTNSFTQAYIHSQNLSIQSQFHLFMNTFTQSHIHPQTTFLQFLVVSKFAQLPIRHIFLYRCAAKSVI